MTRIHGFVVGMFTGTLLACGSPTATKSPNKEQAADKKQSTVSASADPTKPDSKPTPTAAPKVDPPDAQPAQQKPPATKTDSPIAAAKPAPATAPERVLLGSPELLAGIPGTGPLTVDQIRKWLADERNHVPLAPELPLGLSLAQGQIVGLDKNPLTRAKIELGRQLYFDKRLSKDNSISCATCHMPEHGYAAATQFGVGIGGQQGNRNSPVAYNRILSGAQFWDGRAASLEEQALGPIQNPIEMGNTHDFCMECLKKIEGYRLQFERIFGGMTIEHVGQAIASFERAIVTGPSPYDYEEVVRKFQSLPADELESLEQDDPIQFAIYTKAKADAAAHPMSESAKRGRDLFFSDKAQCATCHVGANFTDEKYHNLGVGMAAAKPDRGRAEITKDDKDTGAFKTPTLRNVALTAPYMHDGSQKTLEEVVEWYAKGGHPNPHLSDKIKKLDLSDQDKKDLVEFMKALTGPLPKVESGRLPE